VDKRTAIYCRIINVQVTSTSPLADVYLRGN
jgi:hypothetical protein